MFIYKITNKVNNKSYIGQTTRSVEARLKEHCRTPSHLSAISNAIRKHGIDNFEVECLATCDSLEELNHKEQYYISELTTLSPNGYNLTTGGFNSIPCQEIKDKVTKSRSWYKHSEETKRKLSLAKMGNQVNLGRKYKTEDVNKRIANNPNTKLNAEKINEIRKMLENGVSAKEISQLFVITTTYVYRIKNKTAWRNVI